MATPEFKYVRFERIGFVLWPRTDDLWHSHVGDRLGLKGGRILSAGFAILAGGVHCFGLSESLGISSLPEDAQKLAEQTGLPVWKSE